MTDIRDGLAAAEGFEWDASNAPKIWDRHEVTPLEAEQVFFNQPLIALPDVRHSQQEDRSYALGQTDGGRHLFVVFTLRDKMIRVISARDMSRRERKEYRSAQEKS